MRCPLKKFAWVTLPIAGVFTWAGLRDLAGTNVGGGHHTGIVTLIIFAAVAAEAFELARLSKCRFEKVAALAAALGFFLALLGALLAGRGGGSRARHRIPVSGGGRFGDWQPPSCRCT